MITVLSVQVPSRHTTLEEFLAGLAAFCEDMKKMGIEAKVSQDIAITQEQEDA